jgi:hypothetical protein
MSPADADPRRTLPPHLTHLVPLERAFAAFAAKPPRLPDPEALAIVVERLHGAIPKDDWDEYQMWRAFWRRVDAGASIRTASRETAKDFRCSPRTVQRRIYGKSS